MDYGIIQEAKTWYLWVIESYKRHKPGIYGLWNHTQGVNLVSIGHGIIHKA